ncbi:MAG: coiled-coil domain-containing protein [Kiritimatiellia bacterium]
MDTPFAPLPDNGFDELERRLLRRQKLILAELLWLARRYRVSIALAALLAAIAASMVVWKGIAAAGDRYTTSVRLLYVPARVRKEWEPLKAKVVIELCTSRQLLEETARLVRYTGTAPFSDIFHVELNQKRDRQDIIRIDATGYRHDFTVDAANAYARAASETYAAYWRGKLADWRTLRQTERQNALRERDELDRLLATEIEPPCCLSPSDELARQRAAIAARLDTLAKLNTTREDLESSLRQEQRLVQALNPGALPHADELDRLRQRWKDADAEAANLARKYTEKNPKLAMAIIARDAARTAYDTFVENHHLQNFDPNAIPRLRELQESLARHQEELNDTKLRLEALQTDLAALQKKAEQLVAKAARHDARLRRRETLSNTLLAIDAELAEAELAETALPLQLQSIEPATDAIINRAFGAKALALALAAGAGAALLMLILRALLYTLRGTVHTHRDAELLSTLPCIASIPGILGKMPVRWLLFMLYAQQHYYGPDGILLVMPLPGATLLEPGRRRYAPSDGLPKTIFLLHLESFNPAAADAEADNAPSPGYRIIHREPGARSGYISRRSHDYLDAQTINPLIDDIHALRREFASVHLLWDTTATGRELVIQQLLPILDGLEFVACAASTPNRALLVLAAGRRNLPAKTGVLLLGTAYAKNNRLRA